MPTGRRMKGLKIEEGSGVDSPAHLAPGWAVFKSEGAQEVEFDLDELTELVESVEKEEASVTDEEKAQLEEQLEALTKRAEEAEAKLAEQVAKASGKSPAEIELEKAMESWPEPVRKAWRDQQERVAKAEEAVAKEREARLSEVYLAKARDFEALPEKPDALATALREVDERLTKEAGQTIHRLLKAGDAALGEKVLGDGYGGQGVESDAEQALKAKAEEIRKAHPDLSSAQALDRAYEQYPDLVVAARKEREGSR